MKLQELRFINRMIKAETCRYCQGLVPSMDEIGELTMILAGKTYNMFSASRKINQSWFDAVGNTVIGIIAKEI